MADWLLRVDLMRGGYASDEASPGLLRGHTKCTVATDPTVGKGNQSDRKLQTSEGCNGTERVEVTTHMPAVDLKIRP